MKLKSSSFTNEEIIVSLIHSATPRLYDDNAFWVLNCSPTASEREIKKKIQLQKIKRSNKTLKSINLDEPNYDHFRTLKTRVRNPETRIIDEFFTFWSNDFTITDYYKNKDAKSVQKAITEILQTIRQFEPKINNENYRILHDLAIYVHYHSIQLEKLTLKNTKFDQIKQRIWSKSLELWNKCNQEEAIWSHMRQRIHEFSDPRLTTGSVRRFKKTLLPAIYSINFHFFYLNWKSQYYDNSIAQIQLLNQHKAGPGDLEISFRIVGESLINQINRLRNQLDSAESKGTNWQPPLEEFQIQVSEPIKIVQDWLPESSTLRNELSDSIASSIMKYTIKNCQEHQDYQAAVRWLQYALGLSTSTTLKQRIEQNLKNALLNQDRETCWFCDNYLSDNHSNAIVPLDASLFGHLLPKKEPLETIQIPRCTKCKLIHLQHNKFSWVGSLIGLVCGILAAFWIVQPSLLKISISSILGFLLGYGIVYSFVLNRITRQTKPYHHYKEHPAYKKRAEDFNFNHPSSNEFPRKV